MTNAGTSTALEKLQADLQSENPTARRYAAQDLGDLRDTRAVPALVKALESGPVAVQEACVDALLAIGGEATCQRVAPLLRREGVSLRNYAVEILASLGPAAVPMVVPLCSDRSEDIRKYAIDILARVVHSSQADGFETLLRCLGDPNVNVAGAAAEALGCIGDPVAVPFLRPHASGAPWMQCCVVAALIEIDRAAGTQALAALDHPKLAPEARLFLRHAILAREQD